MLAAGEQPAKAGPAAVALCKQWLQPPLLGNECDVTFTAFFHCGFQIASQRLLNSTVPFLSSSLCPLPI